ncbi:CDP-alcohol phosphatidyltransferase family protein [uncultured Microbulbifer sp.]|uniref:CDP-alcohol phosphatidyltransferase family protein n=1 Tax=uncultured Microbulbifer sp. TaxID=348147 RepID=UPI002637D712|nr:CDP-alcohol phosphatidyltransferase family protein [uncultured Microbulbifer sp.]
MTSKKGSSTTDASPVPPSRWRHLPNVLSISRVVLILPIIWLSLAQQHLWALVVFGVAVVSDLLDGFLARRYNWQSHLGSLLDPIADRVFVLCLIPLLWYFSAIGTAYTILVVVRYAIQLSILPVLLLWLKKPFRVAPDWVTRFAAMLVFLVLGLGFADLVVIEYFDKSTAADKVFQRTLHALTFLGCLFELVILYRFVPRYWQVLRDKHDTFE